MRKTSFIAEMKKTFIAGVAVAAALLVSSQVAFAASIQCTGFMIGTLDGDIVVPEGATCVLDIVSVSGNVTVQSGGSLQIDATSLNSTIRGNIKGHGCYAISIGSASPFGRIVIGGDVTISDCIGPVAGSCRGDSSVGGPAAILIGGNLKCTDNAGGCTVRACTVAGDFQCSGNSFACSATFNTVGGNATLNDNGGIDAIVNAIGGNLKCNGNGSVVGIANIVAGTKSGQCSIL